MKATILLILCNLLTLYATGFSQSTVTMKGENVSLKTALVWVEQEAQVKFVYRDETINNFNVSFDFQNSTIEETLKTLLQGTGSTFRFLGNNLIVISPVELLQGITVTGTVIEKGEPLPGVNVVVKGTTTGVVTDINGKYQIVAPNTDAVLVYSFVGYTTVEMPVGTQRAIDIELSEDARHIEEVVVIGYGTQKKVNLTGSVAAVKVDETLSGRTLSNVSVGLQGILPGLAVSQNSGMAGGNDVSLTIRGMGTINNADPLIVVDGMPDVDINRINMNDIENISVLKDAASSAVYGSRAANGVILITTRTGKGAEKTSVNLSGSVSWGVPTKAYEFMPDYPRALTVHRNSSAVSTSEASQGFDKGTIDQWMALGMIDPVKFPNTDWWDIVLRTSQVQNYNLSFTGNGEKSNFFASIGIMDEKGLQIKNDYTRYTGRFNYDYRVKDNMTLG
ncbi:MAG: carboxypeptidase-like regulatory domain-containing protein, partial [Tannerella sp.]|nr:carboxypeptidase-like regulatory domain-containing protein [Tannerella sp.]